MYLHGPRFGLDSYRPRLDLHEPHINLDVNLPHEG